MTAAGAIVEDELVVAGSSGKHAAAGIVDVDGHRALAELDGIAAVAGIYGPRRALLAVERIGRAIENDAPVNGAVIDYRVGGAGVRAIDRSIENASVDEVKIARVDLNRGDRA